MSLLVAFSSSSPLASVALLEPSGGLIWADSAWAPRAATAACARLLETGLAATGLELASASGFGADIGPGSFTGVRVGVTMAKTLAFANGARTFSATAFDLVSVEETVSLPSRKGEWWVRRPGHVPERSERLEGLGYDGLASAPNGRFPSAAAFGELLVRGLVGWFEAVALVPEYLAEPSISTPKKPFRQLEAAP